MVQKIAPMSNQKYFNVRQKVSFRHPRDPSIAPHQAHTPSTQLRRGSPPENSTQKGVTASEKSISFLTLSKYAKLAKCSTDTALRDIRELLERNTLVQNPGGGRSTSYRLADPQNVRD